MDHPRPQFRRADWLSLDGAWQFCFDDSARFVRPADVQYDRVIEVPYAPEAPLSGVGDTGFHSRCWYQRCVAPQSLRREAGDRLMLHFGAVDYRAAVWVDGRRAGQHTGGHSPFSLDITEMLDDQQRDITIAVLAEDDPLDMHKPRGKQDWLAQPHGIWYPRTTGIWRSVWLERVPAAHLGRLRWTADSSTWQISLSARVEGACNGMTMVVKLQVDGRPLTQTRMTVTGPDVQLTLHLPDAGIDDARHDLQWSPEHPQLIDASVELLDENQVLVDRIESYTAMRSVRIEKGLFLLNDRPYELRMVLDQGYWPGGQMTATSDQLHADIEAIRRLGFNGARKHQKSEDPRWLYWADKLGLCVWAEMPSAYGFSDATVHALCDEWRALVERDLSHPCVVAWVPVNESWGVPALPTQARQVDLVRALYHMTRALDGSRPVVGNDGWEMPCGDIVCIHDYTDKPATLLQRYGTREAVGETLAHERPGGGRGLLLDGYTGADCPVMLSEFGGIASLHADEEGWGYSQSQPGAEFSTRYAALLAAVRQCKGLQGFCYTQLTDTYLEKNGLMTPERAFKVPPEVIAQANLGEDFRAEDYSRNPLSYSKRWLRKQCVKTEAA